MAQLDGYKPTEYFAWLFSRGRNTIVRLSHILAAITLLAYGYFFSDSASHTHVIILSILWSIWFASSRIYRRHKEKKPLALTPRMSRLFVSTGVLAALIISGSIVVWMRKGFAPGFTSLLCGFLAADLLAPFLIGIAATVNRPFEKLIHQSFKKRAIAKLASMTNLKVVAITGSYGKTSTKFAIAAILGHRFNVLASPGSFNTPMGLCLVINNQLRSDHAVLVAEMGARYPGDIQELCDLVQPDIGIITNVGVAHLESMGSVDAIEKEKGTLVENVSADGTVILNMDDPRVARMATRTEATVVGVGTKTQGANVWATDVRYDKDGAHFVAHSTSGDSASFTTALLGDHNISNILLAIAVGSQFGLRMRQMAHAVKNLKPVRHRLELKNIGEYTILDDAFNSNPIGAANALHVLDSFDTSLKIVITPGMIELGELQHEKNFEFGKQIAQVADKVILVGPKQTKPIQDGLEAERYDTANLTVVRSLTEAQNTLRTIVQTGAVVLYENDLPDQFAE